MSLLDDPSEEMDSRASMLGSSPEAMRLLWQNLPPEIKQRYLATSPAGTQLHSPNPNAPTSYGGGYTPPEPTWGQRLADLMPTREGMRRFATTPLISDKGELSPTAQTAATIGVNALPGTPIADLPSAASELYRAQQAGDVPGMILGGLKGAGAVAMSIPIIGGLAKNLQGGVKDVLRGERAAASVEPTVAREAEKLMPVDGTLNAQFRTGQAAPDVLFRGRHPHEFTPQDWGDFGRAYGVGNLGPANEEAWRKSLGTVKTATGREVTIPGGIDSKEPFSYYDLLHLKSQGIDPNDLMPGHHQAIHDRMVKAMTAPGGATDEQIMNQILLGMISPNQPLTANELALQRIAVKGPKDIEALGNMSPYRYEDGPVSKQERASLSGRIAGLLGVGKRPTGLGVSGSANYFDMSEMAQKYKDRPDFFRLNLNDNSFGGMTDAEKYAAHVDRLQNEVRGLGTKTGSFSTVWQHPDTAAISAVDRHMVGKFRMDMFPDTAEADKWGKTVIDRWNTVRPKQKVGSIEELLATPGGKGHFVDQALGYVGNTKGMVTKMQDGSYNPNLPDYLKNTNWIGPEPANMQMMGAPYKRVLGANAGTAQAAGQGLFSNQWMLWDGIRGRLEPHEIMFPGLEKLPRMSLEQMRGVRNVHGKAGYIAPPGKTVKTKPVANPSHMGYFSLPPVLAGGALASGLLSPEDDSSVR